MHPALLPILLLSYLPVAWRRTEWTRALAVVSTAATLLLLPVLAGQDTIPSPSPTLAHSAPWEQASDPELDPEEGNPHLIDVTYQVEPWLLFLRDELRDGRLPFWNPFQFSGEPFWSNGSGAPLYPLHLLFAALPLEVGFVLLPWLRLVIAGMGAYALSRALGASPRGALVAGIAFPLSGVVTSWLLYPMSNTHALIPWVFWATERVARRWTAWPWLAGLAGAQLLGGHPETPVFTGMLAALYLLVRGCRRPVATWAAFLGGWAVSLLIAGAALAPLAATVLMSSKWIAETTYSAPSPAVIGELLLRLVSPELHGNPAPTPWSTASWWGPFNYPATAIYAGALTLPLALAGLVAGAASRGSSGRAPQDRDALRESGPTAPGRRWLAVGAVTLFALLAGYQVWGVRHVVLALPIIDKSLTHYLKFGLDFGLAILAARGLDAWVAGEARRTLVATAAAVAALVGSCWLLFSDAWAGAGAGDGAGLTGVQIGWSLGVVTAVAALAAGTALPPARRRAAWLAIPLLLAVDLTLAHAWTNPALPVDSLYPETGAVRFLSRRATPLERVAGTGASLRPNAGMVYRLYDVRGDSPVKLDHYQELYARLGAPDPVYFHPIQRWDDPWLDRLGVGWVVAAPGEPPPVDGDGTGRRWRLRYDGEDARVYRRPGALPLVRWSDDEGGGDGGGSGRPGVDGVGEVDGGDWVGGLTPLERAPGRWIVRWRSDRERTVVIAETWDPGWSARVDGRPAPVERIDDVLLGVRVGPGEGRLELVYHPRGLGLGIGLSVAGLLLLGAGAWRSRPSEGAPAG